MPKRKKLKFDLDICLFGPQGNAYCVMGMWERTAIENGWTKEETGKVLKEAMRGNYTHLIETLNQYLTEEMILPPGQGPAEIKSKE